MDRKTAFTDKSGFQYDAPPAVRTGQDRGINSQPREEFYGSYHIPEIQPSGWNQWGNWTLKFQPDVRFAAVSDKNAWLHAFPEVDAPWKFIDYTYKGTDSSSSIIEPELFSPLSLNQINPSGIMGRLDGVNLEYYVTLYRYQHKDTGNIFTQEQLEANGWKDPSAPPGVNSRNFDRLDAYKKRFCFHYPSQNKGIRLYRHRLEVESTRWGQHANIPKGVINMMAPEDYFEPSGIFSSTIIPKITATAGSTIKNTVDGVIDYTTGPIWRGIRKITIDPVPSGQIFTVISASGTRFAEWSFMSSGNPIQQQSPNMSRDTVLDIKFIGGSFADGDWVHNGCKFWIGNINSSVTCSLATDIPSGDAPNVPNPVLCPLYDVSASGVSPKQAYINAGGQCPYYSPEGPRNIATYEANAATRGEYASMFAGIENYSDAGGGNNLANGGAMFSGSNTPIGGGTAAYGGFALGAAAALKTPISLPRELSDTTIRFGVSYEYKKIPAIGRETIRQKPPYSKPEFENYVRGTGRFAFDEKDTNYTGVDTNFFGNRNMMSASRFNHSVMPCYNPSKCNKAYGFKMTDGYSRGTYSAINGEDYCRYYTSACPSMTVPRRAYEYDKSYSNSIRNILHPFRINGLNAFNGLSQYKITPSGIELAPFGIENGVFAAVGPSGVIDVDTLELAPNTHIYFYYEIPVSASGHINSNIFCHIKQYNHDNEEVFMDLPSSGENAAPSGFPSKIPWLTKLYGNYRSPSGFTFFVTNEKKFFGGRNPEYKDRSTTDRDEVLITAAEGGGTQDMTNGGKGGDPMHTVQDKGYFRGYWIDRSGDFIVDGRKIGNVAPSGYEIPSEYIAGGAEDPPASGYRYKVVSLGSRQELVPRITDGATPIAGATSNTVVTPDKTVGPKISKLYIFSSDTREILDCENMNNVVDPDTGRAIPPASVHANHLPTERGYFRCPRCSYDSYSWPTPQHPMPPSGYTAPNASGVIYDENFPSVDQIFTDFEAESLEYQCPVCGCELGYQGLWENFPKCFARGVATIFGLPGMTVRNDGFYFKNHPLITRSLVSEIVGKLGPLNPGGYGYSLERATSASIDSESKVIKLPRPSGFLLKRGLPEPSGRWEGSSFPGYTPISVDDANDQGDTIDGTLSDFSRNEFGTDSNILHEEGMTSTSENRLDGNVYDDRIISPYSTTVPGLDMVTLNNMKALRDKVQPMYGYLIGSKIHQDYYPNKQPEHKKRYSETIERNWKMKAGTLEPQIMAATSTGRDQRAQYWDGGMPGTTLYEYFPTGPTWWRIFQRIGGISRQGGINYGHLDDSTTTEGGLLWGYTGDKLVSKAFFFLHGYVPLDKEVVKAYAIITPDSEPEKGPIGTTWSGRTLLHHYHAFRTLHEDSGYGDHFETASNDEEDNAVITQPASPALSPDTSTDYYVPYTWNRTDVLDSIMQYASISKDKAGGTDSYIHDWSNFLTWNDIGTNIIQNETEESIWKKYTYEEYQDIIKADTMKCKYIAGEESEQNYYDFYMFSRRLLNQTFAEQQQSIPGMFDLSGMNDKLFYPRSGPIFETKNFNTTWANDGQVIIQSKEILSKNDGIMKIQSAPLGGLDISAGNTTQWGTGDLGVLNAGWQQRVLDITNVVKTRYNQRLARAFSPDLGISYSEIHQKVHDIRNSETFDTNKTYPPSKGVNYRYWNSNYGQWLNDPWHYPELVADEFKTIQWGDKYKFDQEKRIKEVSNWWINPNENNPDNPNYYKYHPKQLLMATTGGFDSAESPPASGIPAPSGYWYVLSEYTIPQTFELDLRGYPIESSRRPWRYESGHYDVSNVVCPNSSCPINIRNQTVSEFLEWSQSVPGKATTIPSLTSRYCAISGDDLVNPPASGARFVGGDGIETVRYRNLPDPDPFISAIKVNPVGNFSELSSLKQSFSIQVKSSTGLRYRTLLSVDWLKNEEKWRWPEYNSSGEVIFREEHSLPNFFTGFWANAEELSNVASEDMNGKNFIIPKARYIRYTSSPKKITTRWPSPSGLTLGNDNMSTNIYEFIIPSGVGPVYDGRWQGGKIQISYDFSSSEVYETTISSNYPSGVFTVDKIINPSGTWNLPSEVLPSPSGSPNWRFEKDFYVSCCGEFEVYGYDVEEGQLTMTEDAKTFFSIFTVGANVITLPEFPTKIISVRSGIEDISSIEIKEVENITDQDFYWKTETKTDARTGQEYEFVTGGSYVFDVNAIAVILPTQWKNSNNYNTGNIWDMNSNVNPDGFEIQTIPQFVEVRYFDGIGLPITVGCTAVGPGPSYQLEKEAVSVIQGQEPEGVETPTGIPITSGTLPNLGSTVKLNSSGFSSKKDIPWQVYNHSPLYGEFDMDYLIGNELGASRWQESDIAKLFGGMTQEDGNAKSAINGTVSGELTFYGAPNTILSGDIYAYAPAMTKREYTSGTNHVVTYERTGGLKYTGFSIGAELYPVVNNRQGICFSMPTVLVYLRERDNTIEPIMT